MTTPTLTLPGVTDITATSARPFVTLAYADPEFILQMETTGASETITLPITGSVDVDIDWGDGSDIETFSTINPSHVYATADTYDIKVTGSCGVFGFNNGGDKDKLLAVLNGGTGFTAGSFDGGFYGCTNLATADFKGLDTSSVANMAQMFRGCTSLTSLDASGFDTANVASMLRMFNSCPGLTTLDVSGFNTAKVTNMRQMFNNCSGLTSLDVSSFNTAKVTDMFAMFYICSALTSDPGIHAFNVTALTTAAFMCSGADAMLSTTEYNTILENWEAQAVKDNVEAHFGDATHSGDGTIARDALTLPVLDGGPGWTITDGGAA